MLDWPAISAISAACVVIGGVSTWLISRAYERGSKDAVAGSVDIQHAASIVRLEGIVEKLADSNRQESIVVRERLTRLETMADAGAEAMKIAAEKMGELTEQVAGLVAVTGKYR